MWGPTKNLGPIGSVALTFNWYNQTDKEIDKQSNIKMEYIQSYDIC